MRIGLTSIYVDDQDQAEQFYTQVLDFQVKASAPYGPEERWLTVVAPRTGGCGAGAAPGRRAGAGVPGGQPPGRTGRFSRCAPTTANATPSWLKAKGAVFVKERGPMPYGGIRRGLRRQLRQPAQPPPGLEGAAVVPPAGPGGPLSASLWCLADVPPVERPTVNTAARARKGHDQSNAEPPSRAGRQQRQQPSQAGHAPLAGSSPAGARHPGEEDIMLVEHAHPPGRFDPGHCRGCAREADLLDHYRQVQREEQAFKEATDGPAGPTGRPAATVVLRHRDLAGRRRAPHRLIQRGRRCATASGPLRQPRQRSSSTRSASTPSDVPIPLRAASELAWTLRAHPHAACL